MTSNASATMFTEKLLQVIRQQRHLATRVIIATQEPSISPKLLDLSSMTIIHRFTSPAWFKVLRNHLAATSALGEFDDDGKTNNTGQTFAEIIKLGTGEALLFSPAAMLKIESSNTHTHNDNKEGKTAEKMLPEKLGIDWAKVRVRMRLTDPTTEVFGWHEFTEGDVLTSSRLILSSGLASLLSIIRRRHKENCTLACI